MNFGGDHPAHGDGKISPRCIPKLPAMARYRPDAFPKGHRTRKTPVRGNISPPCIRIQLILARYACYVSRKPRKAPLGNAPREHLATKGRFRRRSTRIMHGARILPSSDGTCPCPSASPIPAACRAHCSRRQAADGLRRRSSGAWPAVRPSPEDRRRRHLDGQADNGMLRGTGPGFQNRENKRAQSRRACVSAAENAHRKDESLLAEL